MLVTWILLEEEGDAEDDKFGKLEAMIKKAMDTMTAAKSSSSKKKGGGGGSSAAEGSADAEGSAVEEAAAEE